MINYQADIVLIGYFLTATDVGYYAVAVGLSRFFWIIPQAIQRITYPATSEYWAKNNHSALQTMIDKSMKYTTCVLLPIGLGVGFFAKDIITIIFGEGFSYVVLPLQILIVGTIFLGVFKSIGGVLSGLGRPDLSLNIHLVAAVTNVILNIVLVPYFGISGAALATSVSFMIITIIGICLVFKLTRMRISIKWYSSTFALTLLLIALFLIFWKCVNIYLLGLSILSIQISMIFKFMISEEDKIMIKSLIREMFGNSD
ncbi:lipid II flippase MurJ [subsurface metagenome]